VTLEYPWHNADPGRLDVVKGVSYLHLGFRWYLQYNKIEEKNNFIYYFFNLKFFSKVNIYKDEIEKNLNQSGI
jgi:hypothetical protein